MPATPDIREAARNAQDFSRRFDGVLITVYECRRAGSAQPIGYVVFLSKIEPEQGDDGFIYTPIGSFKAGKSVN